MAYSMPFLSGFFYIRSSLTLRHFFVSCGKFTVFSFFIFNVTQVCMARAQFYGSFNSGHPRNHQDIRHDPFFARPYFYGAAPFTGHSLDHQLMYDLHYRPVMGRWSRMWYADRYGWWWNVGQNWYLYDQPIYPYPATNITPIYAVIGDQRYNTISTTTILPPQNAVGTTEITTGKILLPPRPDLPPVQIENKTIIPAGTVQTNTSALPPSNQVWYYCRDPKGYYPYVEQCPTGWSKVPTRPLDAP